MSLTRRRFADFEVDLKSRELFRRGRRLRLADKPFAVLAALLERPGEVVLRRELQQRLWPADTFVDFDNNLNTAVNKLRDCLGDAADSPRFIETLPKRGYRFLVPLEDVPAGDAPPAGAGVAEPVRPGRSFARRAVPIAGGALVAVVLLAVAALLTRSESSGGESRAAPARLLVQPFANLSGDPSQEHLADGMTEEAIARLARLQPGRLQVVARTSSFQLKGDGAPLADLARRVDAGLVLSGAVQKQGERLRVNVQLIAVEGEATLWAETFDGGLHDLFGLQSRVAAGAARVLARRLSTPGEVPAAAQAALADPAAYEDYLEARYLLGRNRREATARAVDLLADLTRREPHFADAWAALATALARLGEDPRRTEGRLREAVARTLELAPESPEGLLRQAALELYTDWDWPAAAATLDRAVVAGGGLAAVQELHASFLSLSGRHEEALAAMATAQRLDPIAVAVAADSGWYLYVARRYEEAVAQCRRALELEPEHPGALHYLILSESARGDEAAALTWARRRMQTLKATSAEVAELDAGGLQGYWRWHRDRLRASADYVSPGTLALAALAAGDRAEALDLLERAYEEHSGWVLPFLQVYPALDPLRDEPRFRALAERMAFESL